MFWESIILSVSLTGITVSLISSGITTLSSLSDFFPSSISANTSLTLVSHSSSLDTSIPPSTLLRDTEAFIPCPASTMTDSFSFLIGSVSVNSLVIASYITSLMFTDNVDNNTLYLPVSLIIVTSIDKRPSSSIQSSTSLTNVLVKCSERFGASGRPDKPQYNANGEYVISSGVSFFRSVKGTSSSLP